MNDAVNEETMNEAVELDEPTISPEEELAMLKRKADTLGVPYGPRIGSDTLRAKIAIAMGDGPEDIDEENEAPVVQEEPAPRAVQRKPAAPVAAPKTKRQVEAERVSKLRKKMSKEQLKLVRLRISNLNPTKKDLGGEIFSVTNKYLGTVKKFIPYDEASDEGWHVPHILYEQMKARKFLSVSTRRVKGQIQINQRWVPEFALEVLPSLTQAELSKLGASQAAAGGMSE